MYLLIENQLVEVKEKFSLDHIIATKDGVDVYPTYGYHINDADWGYYFEGHIEPYELGSFITIGGLIYVMIKHGWTVQHDGVTITI